MALTFGASGSDTVTVPATSTNRLMPGPLTIAAWVKASSIVNGATIYGSPDDGAHGSVIMLRIDSTGHWTLRINGAGGVGTAAQYVTVTTCPVESWVFIVATYDVNLGTNQGHLYLGSLAAPPTAATLSQSTDASSAAAIDVESGTQHTWGNRVAGATFAWRGDLACGWLFSRILTTGELLRLWERGAPAPNLVMRYEFGFTGAVSQTDWSGNKNTGTISGPTQSPHVPRRSRFGTSSRRFVSYVPAATSTIHATAAGTLALTGSAAATTIDSAVAAGTLSLVGSAIATATVQATAPGTLSLVGSATGSTGSVVDTAVAAGTLSLVGSATAKTMYGVYDPELNLYDATNNQTYKCTVYRPDAYDGTVPYGLVIWVPGSVEARGSWGANNPGVTSDVDFAARIKYIDDALRLQNTKMQMLVGCLQHPDTSDANEGYIRQIVAAIALIKSTYNVDPRRVVLLGFSQGAQVSYTLSYRTTGVLSGVVALSDDLFPINFGQTTVAATIPIATVEPRFIGRRTIHYHGTGDGTLPVQDARDIQSAVVANGATQWTYHEGSGDHTTTATTALNSDAMWNEVYGVDTSFLTAAGTLPLVGAASANGSGTADTGTANGVLFLVGSATAASLVQGSATGTLSPLGTATGATLDLATATGLLNLVGTATGTLAVAAVASDSLQLLGAASANVSGVDQGVATGLLPLIGLAGAVVLVQGAAPGVLSLTGSATATVLDAATAPGLLTLTGSATAAVRVHGTASDLLTLSGTSTGATLDTATASGILNLVGVFRGNLTGVDQADAEGTLPLLGVATAQVEVQGVAAGQLDFVGIAAAASLDLAVAAGVLNLVGTATATSEVQGAAVGILPLYHVATALVVVRAQAFGSLTFVGTATGRTIAADHPENVLSTLTLVPRTTAQLVMAPRTMARLTLEPA